MAGLTLIFASFAKSVDSPSTVHTVSTVFAVMILFGIVAAPIALFKKFIRKRTRTVGSRPFVPGRDCRTCGGWGVVDGGLCSVCGGRRTR